MSRFKTAPITRADGEWKIARRKGKRVRYQNTLSAKMTGWCASPEYLAELAAPIAPALASAGEAAQRTAETMAEFAETVTPDYQRMTVPELRTLANDHYGVKVPSKARKADVIGLILAAREGI